MGSNFLSRFALPAILTLLAGLLLSAGTASAQYYDPLDPFWTVRQGTATMQSLPGLVATSYGAANAMNQQASLYNRYLNAQLMQQQLQSAQRQLNNGRGPLAPAPIILPPRIQSGFGYFNSWGPGYNYGFGYGMPNVYVVPPGGVLIRQ